MVGRFRWHSKSLLVYFGMFAVIFAASEVQGNTLRFIVNGAEVTDSATGLVWRRCSEGQTLVLSECVGTAVGYTWHEALVHASSETTRKKAWRLPNPKELASLVDDSRVRPAIDGEAFPNTPAFYFWTSTYATGDATFAWLVDFERGFVSRDLRSNSRNIRLVRFGP